MARINTKYVVVGSTAEDLDVIHIQTNSDVVLIGDTNETLTTRLSSWGTSRTLTITGDASGTTSFGPTGNVSVSIEVADDSHSHTGSTVSTGTANRVIVSSASRTLESSSVTTTELGYLSGVTSAIQTQLNNKISTSARGAANGVAPLDADSKISQQYLPSYVDDVIDGTASADLRSFTDLNSNTVTLETGKIYNDVNTNKSYRYSGTALVALNEGVALGETSSTAYRGDRGAIAYTHSQTAHAPADANKTEKGTTNGTIKNDGGSDITIYEHPDTAGNKHIPANGASGNVLKYGGTSGVATWGSVDLSEVTGTDDLKSIEALTGVSGFLKKTGANTWALDTTGYLSTHPTVTPGTDGTDSASPTFGGTFTALSGITKDSNGHVTAVTTKTVTIPSKAMGAANATTAGSAGLVPAPAAGDQNKLLTGAGTWVDQYTHPTTAGNKHIPAGGASTNVLKYSSAGTAEWGNVGLSEVNGADDLKAIEALTGTTGLLKKTAANTWALDTSSYLTAHPSVSAASSVTAANRTYVKSLTFDSFGHVTGVTTGTETVTNTDTKVNVTLATTSKAYLLGVTTTPTSSAQALTTVSDTGVYLDTTAGKLTATSFAGNGANITNLNMGNAASGTLAVGRGGTGATTAAAARTSLGVINIQYGSTQPTNQAEGDLWIQAL